MSEEEKPKKKKGLEFELGPEDSALIVRSNGHIELVSRELQDNDDESNYLGDLEDLNKTFTLVLAFAAALENEQLYQHIFHNLNNVLHRQWKKLPPEEKARTLTGLDDQTRSLLTARPQVRQSPVATEPTSASQQAATYSTSTPANHRALSSIVP